LTVFNDVVAKCHADNPKMSDIREGYGAMHRTKDRYLYEVNKEQSLDRAEYAALRKVFENDNFIQSMGYMRQISEHVLPKEDWAFYHPNNNNSPFQLTLASSAQAAFSGPSPTLMDAKGQPQHWPHIKYLAEAERRIVRAYKKAQGS
jgi:hypothetical protein